MELKGAVKQILNKKTTEELFKIIDQPPDTCPMIDELIEDLVDYSENLKGYFALIQSSFIINTNDCSCDIDDYIEDFNLTLEDIITKIDEKIEKTDILIKELNLFRKFCENLRQNGKNNKQKIWDELSHLFLTDSSKIVPIRGKGLYNPTRIMHEDFFLSFNSLNLEMINVEFLEVPDCDECSTPDIVQNKIDKIKKSKFKDHVFQEKRFEKMKSNYEHLFLWNKQIESLKIKDAILILLNKVT